MTNIDYHGYETWKKWTLESFGELPYELERTYEYILAQYAPNGAKYVLDYGYGNGEMLSVMRKHYQFVFGVEVTDYSIQAAKLQGFNVYEKLSDVGDSFEAHLDVITAFHVLEHLTKAELEHFFFECASVTQKGSRVIAAFPNGDSPWSAPAFNGDITHRTLIGRSMAEQLAYRSGYRLVRFDDFPSPSSFSENRRRRLLSKSRRIVERLLNRLISRIYFGGTDMALSPVSICVWERV
jgi:cyclopropane fatty-acyl-phospholipid synthase-like methyltransferase